jgi:predicted CoA-binding protein
MVETDDELRALYRSVRSIAIVGLSRRNDRASHPIATYLQSLGYRIYPVNPNASGRILGQTVYRDLKSLPQKVDVVQVFRRSEDVPQVIEEAIAVKAPIVWLQLGVVNDQAAERARQAGIRIVVNKCMLEEHLRLFPRPFVQ